jgi:hypothetical protein
MRLNSCFLYFLDLFIVKNKIEYAISFNSDINQSLNKTLTTRFQNYVRVKNGVATSNTISNATYLLLKKNHELYLKDKGVKLPRQNTSFGMALCCLYENVGKPVHHMDVREYVEKNGIDLSGPGDTLQIRHLAMQYGYNILKAKDRDPKTGIIVPLSHFVLVDVENAYPAFHAKRRVECFSEEEWEKLKMFYENKCVNCGSIHGKPMRWNPYRVTELQKGHMDPRLPLTLTNIIPQCAFCNQQYKNKAIFNSRGSIVDWNSDGFV